MKKPRIKRDLPEMVNQLERQLRLLAEYSEHAFEDGRSHYLPEIAGKLRILLVRSRFNHPLLFRVAEHINYTPKVELSGPPVRPLPGEPGPNEVITLDRFFDLHAVTIRTWQGPARMTKRELIRAWCEQLGGVHEDWEVDEELANTLGLPIIIGGMHPGAYELRICAQTALQHGQQIIERYKKEVENNED